MTGYLPFDAVIFDMDGLLLDTERIAFEAFQETCGSFGLGNCSDVFLRCVGTNKAAGERVLREGLAGRADFVAFASVWDRTYVRMIERAPVPLKAGVIDLLNRIEGLGVPAGVATSTSTSRARQKLNDAGIAGRFAVVVGGDAVDHSKPHPAIYLKAAETLGVSPARCLAIEDSENGVRSALAAGMTVIQIPDLVAPSDELRALGHTILDSLDEVVIV